MMSTVDEARSPRDFTDEPESFGRAQSIQWKRVAPLEQEALLLAAQWQHASAVRIRWRIKATKSNLKTYARSAGTSYDRLGKVLRGVIVMRLEDIAVADILLGGVSGFTDQPR